MSLAVRTYTFLQVFISIGQSLIDLASRWPIGQIGKPGGNVDCHGASRKRDAVKLDAAR